MYKLLLLDDEEIIIDSILKVFHMEDYGFELAGAYSNPLKALDDLRDLEPDLIITDIRMPGMNGLEFAKRAKEMFPDVEIVILSGYTDFAYAQEAVKIGVRDYLLKPIKKDDYAGMLMSMRDRIREKKEKDESYNDLKQIVETNQNDWKNHFLLTLVEDIPHNWEWVRDSYQKLNLDFADSSYMLIKFAYNHTEFKKDSMSEIGKIVRIFSEELEDYGRVENFISDENIFFLLYDIIDGDYDEICEIVSDFCEEQKENGVELKSGWSGIHTGIRQVFTAGAECNQMLWAADALAEDSVRHLTQMRSMNIAIPYEKLEDLFREIMSGDEKSLKKSVEEIYQMSEPLGSRLSLQFSYSITFLILLRMYQLQLRYELSQKVVSEEMLELKYLRNHYKTVQDQCSMVEEKSLELAGLMQKNESKAPSKTVLSALNYIRKHYTENISLDDTAHEIGISKNYLCDIFKKELDVTFVTYITNLRIEKAKELLTTSDMKMYEISMAVGYNDYTYFSQIFKKHTGMTLSAYRKHH